MSLLRRVVVWIDLRPHLHLFDFDAHLLLPCLLLANVAFVLELAVVHDAADGRVGLGRHLHQIQVELLGPAHRILDRDDADLCSVGSHQPDLRSPDPLVHACVKSDSASPPGRETKESAWSGRSREKIEPRALHSFSEYRSGHRHSSRRRTGRETGPGKGARFHGTERPPGQTGLTFEACFPLGPSTTSNSTS